MNEPVRPGGSVLARVLFGAAVAAAVASCALCCGGQAAWAALVVVGAAGLGVGSFVVAGAVRLASVGTVPSSLSPEDARRVRFVEAVVRLSVHVGMADGTFGEAEQASIVRFFGLTDFSPRVWVRRVVLTELRQPDLVGALSLASSAATDESERAVVVLALAAVAGADGKLDPREVAVIVAIAHGLGFTPQQASALILLALGVDVGGGDAHDRDRARQDAAQVLGVAVDASEQEVRAAWKAEARKHHPDRVAHLGPEFVRLAGERMTRLNQARDVLLAPRPA